MGRTGAVPSGEPFDAKLRARANLRNYVAIQLAANATGIGVVLAYLSVFFPVVTEDEAAVELNLAVFGAYLLLTVLVAVPVNTRLLHQALHWVHEGRAPTLAERRDTLATPARQASSTLLGWLGAAVIFGLLNDDRARISWGLAIAGMLTSTLLYQMLERYIRPLYAPALAGVDWVGRQREVRPRIMLAWFIGSAIPLLAVGVAPAVLPAAELEELVARISALVVISLVAGGLVMRGAAGSVAEPIERVRTAMAAVEDGDLDVHVPVDHIGELGRLQAGFNAMVEGLRERRRVEAVFGRLVGADVARAAVARDPELGGEERIITALFVDRAGFTAFAEQHSPVEIVAELNRFFGAVIEVVEAEGGWVNKFEGDAALCLFGTPADQPDHAQRALRAAARLPGAVAELPAAPHVGVGVATGRVVAGHVGASARHEYTVIGDAVNVASRLTEMAKGHEARVLVASSTIDAARASHGDTTAWRSLGPRAVRGREAAIEVFEPVTGPTADDRRGTGTTPPATAGVRPAVTDGQPSPVSGRPSSPQS